MPSVRMNAEMEESIHCQSCFLGFSTLRGDAIKIPHPLLIGALLREEDIAAIGAPGQRDNIPSILLEAVYFPDLSARYRHDSQDPFLFSIQKGQPLTIRRNADVFHIRGGPGEFLFFSGLNVVQKNG